MSTWRKSSYSVNQSDCVEVGRGVGIRDSKAPSTHLPVSDKAWSAFLTEVKSAR
ncbi:DUF397 domain-containing protein [Lentzea californiensis]|uniref:DUF397 domain-containing protein n=1 Tax=Lentzea californiensis TaxID=438851 RepID=UPI00216433BE|nr:DUF397 domain-containing protein [Lentzea californiensis]MCR3747287.1 protein of unknown function (DUF397) [Lentzea californiensis]